MMDAIFREEVTSGDIIIYMDDILIAITESLTQHCNKVAQILKKLQDNNLFLKPKKCHFHKQEVEYLGIIIGKGQVKMDPVKGKGITNWPIPTNVSELYSFLGFENYYKDFILSYSCIKRPLYNLTKKNTLWLWEASQNNAFQLLKDLFISYPILKKPQPDQAIHS
jgi:Reverse transcriptase (RNA-dependent DNA polymerase)